MNRSVLVIEDHPESGKQLVQMLRRRGFHAEHALTISEALSTIKFHAEPGQHQFDCVISDLGLPDSSAEETLCLLKGFDEEGISVRALTGIDDPELILQAKKLGVPLILKGTSAEGIMESIMHAISDKNPDIEMAEKIIENRSTLREVPVFRRATFLDRIPPFVKNMLVSGAALGIIMTAVTAGAAVYKGLTNRVIEQQVVKVAKEKVDTQLTTITTRLTSVETNQIEFHDAQIKITAKLDELGNKIDENKRDLTHQLDRIEQKR